MDNAIYAALTRQSGLMREMRTVANNMANSSTTGFRREGVVFSEYMSPLANRGAGRETLSMANARGREVDLLADRPERQVVEERLVDLPCRVLVRRALGREADEFDVVRVLAGRLGVVDGQD